MNEYIDVTSSANMLSGDKKIMNFSERFLAVANYLRNNNKKILRSPYMVEIMPEACCPFSCVACSYGKIRRQQIKDPKRARMPLEKLADIIDELIDKDTHGIYISGGGEPTVYPHLKELIEYINKRIGFISLQTNGFDLSKIFNSPAILKMLNIISVSIYGCDEDTFLKTTGSSKKIFYKVQDQIRKLILARDKYKIDSLITAKIMLSPTNYRSVGRMIEFCEKSGFDAIFLKKTENIETGYEKSNNKSLLKGEIAHLVKLLSEYSDRKFVDNFINKVISPKSYYYGKKCYTAEMGMVGVIDTDGHVYAGTAEVGIRDMSIGNVYDNPLSDIWCGLKHQKVIKNMSANCQSHSCKAEWCRHIASHEQVEKFLEKTTSNSKSLNDILDDPLGHFI